MIGIISFLPDDERLRIIRKKNHLKQIEWLRNLFPEEDINVVSQNYKNNDFISGLHYISFSTPIGPSAARNVLLKKFYKSNDDILFLLDDDIMSYDYYDSNQLIRDFYYQTNYSNDDIDIIIPLSPRHKPFKKYIYEECDYTHYHILQKCGVDYIHCSLIKNFKKNYNKEIYFAETNLFTDEAMPEDYLFIYNCLQQDIKIYRCINWIKQDLGTESTLYSPEDNDKLHLRNSLNFKKYLNGADIIKLNKADKIKLLRRPQEYHITENLIPKECKNKLF